MENQNLQTIKQQTVTLWQQNYEICVKGIQVKSVSDVLSSVNPSLALLKKNDPVLPLNILVDLINNFLDFMNIGKTMSAIQVLETAKLILEDYSVLKPDDFVLFFNRAKKGTYGKVYDRMDGSVIFEWLEAYMQQRSEEIETIRINESKSLQKHVPKEAGVPMPDYLKEYRDKINVSPVEKIPVIPKTTPLDDLIHSLAIEFDLLSAEQKTTGLVLFEGIRYDKEGFLKMKLGYDQNN